MSIVIYCVLIVFIATVVRSTFGFGEALTAVPLLALVLPTNVVVPLCVLISIIIAGFVVIQDKHHIHFKSAKWLVIYAILGIPFGLCVLVYGNEKLVKGGLGVLIVLYSIYSLARKNSAKLESDNNFWLFVCGFLSGVLGGAYGINGPPIVIYGNLRKWTPTHFRATLQAYFLPAGIAGMLGYWYKGLCTPIVWHYFFITMPSVIPAILLGRYLNRRLQGFTFFKYVYMGLLGIGSLLLFQFLR